MTVMPSDVAAQAFKMGVDVAFYVLDCYGACGPYACLYPSQWPNDDSQLGRMAEVVCLAAKFPGGSDWDIQPPLRSNEPWTLTMVWRGKNKPDVCLWLADTKRALDTLKSAEPEPESPCVDACYVCMDKPELGLRNPAIRQMVLCRKCGCKRCPHATDHRYACTGSNEPGQTGSRY